MKCLNCLRLNEFQTRWTAVFHDSIDALKRINETINETGTVNEATALVSRQAQH